jgi:hypothetical protein
MRMNRRLSENGFTGPILASITALTGLLNLYAPLSQCGALADRVCDGALWRRFLYGSRFTGSVPAAISALTALRQLYASKPAFPRVTITCVAAGLAGVDAGGLQICVHCGCRDLSGNRFEGQVPLSLFAMRFPEGR